MALKDNSSFVTSSIPFCPPHTQRLKFPMQMHSYFGSLEKSSLLYIVSSDPGVEGAPPAAAALLVILICLLLSVGNLLI